MKTFRMSDTTENRNARMAIDYRGGGCRRGATIPQEQQIESADGSAAPHGQAWRRSTRS